METRENGRANKREMWVLRLAATKRRKKKRRGGQISISDQCEQKTGAIDMSKTDRGKLNDRFWRL